MGLVEELGAELSLGQLLDTLRARCGGWELVDHFTQGEFHHDVVVRVRTTLLPGPILVIATNCNGGVKELLCFADAPSNSALWHSRCPDNAEFAGMLPPLLARSTTVHWFEPSALVADDARSELRVDCRAREVGGGWHLRA